MTQRASLSWQGGTDASRPAVGMIRFLLVALVLMVVLGTTGCGSALEEELSGSWVNSASGAPLRLFPDGSGFFYDIPSEWSISDNNIRIKVGNADGDGTYRLDGDRLEISGFTFMHELNGRYVRSN